MYMNNNKNVFDDENIISVQNDNENVRKIQISW